MILLILLYQMNSMSFLLKLEKILNLGAIGIRNNKLEIFKLFTMNQQKTKKIANKKLKVVFGNE